MKIKVKTQNNYLSDKYTKYASEELKRSGIPYVSFPIEFEDIPSETKSLALTFIDYDAVPVCGFPWIHWIVANIPGNITELSENASEKKEFAIVQGQNSFASPLGGQKDPKIVHQYGGPTPPDKDHDYTLTVYALDKNLNVSNGFYLNELLKEIDGHVLAEKSITVVGRV